MSATATELSPAARVDGSLTPDNLRHYRQNGFLIINNAFAPAEIDELCRETVKICRGQYGQIPGGWHRNNPGITQAAAGESDDDVLNRYLCVHFPHKICQTMRRSIAHPSIVNTLTQVIGPNVKCMQSMLFIKSAGKPGQAWHQDEYYIPTRDRSLAGGWIAMDDATVDNGCLWVIPGSQRSGILWPQHKHEDRRFDCAGEAYQFPYSDQDAVPVEVSRGAVVVFNGYLLHRSLPNTRKSGYRRALVHHYMSAESLLPWQLPKEGEHMGMSDSRDIVMVAGTDPYPWKAVEDLHRPHVRPSGEGGCGNPKHNRRA